MKIGHRALCLALLATAPFASADELQLKDGSILKGKILGIEEDKTLEPPETVFTVQLGVAAEPGKDPFRVPVKVKQSEVTTFKTDGDFFIATAGQTKIKGKVESTPEGVRVTTPDGVVTSSIANIKDGWNPSDPSPDDKAREKLMRHWAYTVDFSLLGKTGNAEAIGESFGFTALNEGPDDKLKFYAKQNYAKAKGDAGWSKTNDDLHAGVDYTSYFAKPVFWYVRSDNGYDKVREINFFSTNAVGMGDRLIDTKTEQLEIRAGFSYRYEAYDSALQEDTTAPGLDFGVHNETKFKYFLMVNDITYTPTFTNFKSDYLIIHDSFIETPLANTDSWKFRIGMRNEYRAKVVPGNDRLDTTYYIKFVLNWK